VIVRLNGEPAEVPEGATVGQVIDSVALDARRAGVAAAVDGEVVPRADWDGRVLDEGARVEVVRAVQGG
jgi:sulfur carrier protein